MQDMASWTRDGIAGLQSVVLYSLPELDGAIDTVPLGGLVNNDIYLVPERVQRLAARLKKWVSLRRTPPKVFYFFPSPPFALKSCFEVVSKSFSKTNVQLKGTGTTYGIPDLKHEHLSRTRKICPEIKWPAPSHFSLMIVAFLGVSLLIWKANHHTCDWQYQILFSRLEKSIKYNPVTRLTSQV